MTKISDEMIEQIDQNNMKSLCILKAASKAFADGDEDANFGSMIDAALDYVSATNEILKDK